MRKQEWFADHLEEIDADLPKGVGKYVAQAARVKNVARDIAVAIDCNQELRRRCSTKDEYYSELVKGVERSGILVFKSGVVGNNGHRPLNVDEFRGFAIVHPRAPAIFINGKDAPAAWIFTLIHEVAHIWLGKSGISDFSASVSKKPDGLEKKCNQIAAEVLTPEDEFKSCWERHRRDLPILNLSKIFKVSTLVIAHRALDFEFISIQEYRDELGAAKRAAASSDGGDYYRSAIVRNSRKFTRAVVSEAFAGRMMLRDAGALLNVSPHAVAELRNRRILDVA